MTVAWMARLPAAVVALTLWAVVCPPSPAATEGPRLDSIRVTHEFGNQRWVGSDDGLELCTNGKCTTWDRNDGLPVDAVSAIDIDPETREVWLGTWGGGLVRFSGGRFDTFSQFNSGLAGDLVFDVAVVHGRVWAATVGGVSSFDPTAETWELYYPRRAYVPHQAVTALVADDDGLYAVLWSGEVDRFDAAARRWTRLTSDSPGGLESLGPSEMPRKPVPPDDEPLEPGRRLAIAIYGPRNRTVAFPDKKPGVPIEPGRPDLLAVEMSMSLANARGGYREMAPFRSVKVSGGYARYGWGLPEDDIVIFAEDPDVAGLVGYLVPEQHFVDAVVYHTRIPWVNVAPPTVPSVEANPWVFRCHGDEPRRHRLLADHLLGYAGHQRLALLRAGGDDTEIRLEWWRSQLDRNERPVVADLSWGGEAADHTATLKTLIAATPDIVVTGSDAKTTAGIVREMRAAGMKQPVVVSAECVTDDFASLVGGSPGEVLALDPTAADPVTGGGGFFAKRYIDRDARGRSPDENAYLSFSATDHLLHAVNAAGPGHEAVRRTLEEMRRSSIGETHHERVFEPPPIRFARLQEGEWVFLPLPENRQEGAGGEKHDAPGQQNGGPLEQPR